MYFRHSKTCNAVGHDDRYCHCGAAENQAKLGVMNEELEKLRGIVESLRRLADNAKEIEYAQGYRTPYVSKLVHASDIVDIIEERMS